MGTPQDEQASEPEFGPSGYLPERASRRARKIVLRAPLGIQWVVGSLVAGLVVVIAGALWLVRAGEGPGEPWLPIGDVADMEASEPHQDLDVVIVTTGGRVRAFAGASDVADGVAYCPASNRLEAPDGRVWLLTGRGLGTESLVEHPTLVQRGRLYVDPSRTLPPIEPSPDTAEPACA